MFINAFERSELEDQRLGSLFADTWNARDVVDRIAPDRHHVDNLLGRQSERLLDTFCVVENLAAGVVQADAIADELEEVFDGGRDDHLVTAIARIAGEGAT